MISFAMHVLLFMDPSMNRADSVALMQIALTHSSLAYLPCLFICLHSTEKNGERHKKRKKKCCTQADTIIKPCTLLCQRGEREDKPSLCTTSPPSFLSQSLLPSLNRSYPQIPPWQGHKKRELVAQIYCSIVRHNWTKADSHVVVYKVHQSFLLSAFNSKSLLSEYSKCLN